MAVAKGFECIHELMTLLHYDAECHWRDFKTGYIAMNADSERGVFREHPAENRLAVGHLLKNIFR